MEISRSACLVLSFILMCGLVPEVMADAEETSGKKKKMWGLGSWVAIRKHVKAEERGI